MSVPDEYDANFISRVQEKIAESKTLFEQQANEIAEIDIELNNSEIKK